MKKLVIALIALVVVGVSVVGVIGSPVGSWVQNYLYVKDWQKTLEDQNNSRVKVDYVWSSNTVEIYLHVPGTEAEAGKLLAFTPEMFNKAIKLRMVEIACSGKGGVSALVRGANFTYYVKPSDSEKTMAKVNINWEDCK